MTKSKLKSKISKKPATKAKKIVKTTAKKKPAPKAKAAPQAAKKTVAAAKKPAVQAKPAVAKAPPKPEVKAAPAPKPVAQPVKPAAPAVAAKPAHPVAPPRPAVATQPAAERPVQAAPAQPPQPRKLSFKINELIVYPAHGVGKVVQIEEQEIAGARLELYIIDFEKEKLRLKVPTNKSEQKGMRKLADKPLIEQAMKVLKGRARIKRTMWSRRAQEYEAKINSGDIIAVAEVVRDLYRSERQPEQSYSERQLFEQALERMAREIAAVKKIDDDMAVKEVEAFLAKNAHRNVKPDEAVPAEEAA
ncbi:MAG: CarD family transcriptional regulator [Parvibaculaceae bacterium]